MGHHLILCKNMEFFYAFLFVISFLLGIAEKSKGLQCFYCGIKDLCELPFDEETVEKIECPNSCLKFEGFSKDGQKVTVRDCGFFDADECTENHVYEGTTAVETFVTAEATS